MGERRHEPKAPAVETTQDLGAIRTSCTVFDNELDRLTRLFGAREDLRPVTAQVQAFLDVVQPLQQRKDELEEEIVRWRAQTLQWEETATAAEEAYKVRLQEYDTETERLREMVEQTKAQVVNERTALREGLAQQHTQYEADVQSQIDAVEARKAELATMLVEAEQAHTTRLAAMQDELERVQEQIEEAKRLREQLTAMRG